MLRPSCAVLGENLTCKTSKKGRQWHLVVRGIAFTLELQSRLVRKLNFLQSVQTFYNPFFRSMSRTGSGMPSMLDVQTIFSPFLKQSTEEGTIDSFAKWVDAVRRSAIIPMNLPPLNQRYVRCLVLWMDRSAFDGSQIGLFPKELTWFWGEMQEIMRKRGVKALFHRLILLIKRSRICRKVMKTGNETPLKWCCSSNLGIFFRKSGSFYLYKIVFMGHLFPYPSSAQQTNS